MLKFISAILLLLCITHIHAGDIIELTDANFEHETQVSNENQCMRFFHCFCHFQSLIQIDDRLPQE